MAKCTSASIEKKALILKTDDLRHHCCSARATRHQTDYQEVVTRQGPATLKCDDCNRSFFSRDCKTKHQLLASSGGLAIPQTRVCDTHKRCHICQKLCYGQDVLRHSCGYGQCPSCKGFVPTDQHQCYLQLIVDETPKRDRTKRGAVAGLATQRANLPGHTLPEEAEADELPPLHAYFDIEAKLLCAEREDTDQQFVFEGETCIEAFSDCVASLTRTDNHKVSPPVIRIAHNFKAYDN